MLGEELRDLDIPEEAHWPRAPVEVSPPPFRDADAVRRTLARLAGLPENTPLERAVRSTRLLWYLNDLLARRPLSLSRIVSELQATVPERRDAPADRVRQEVYAAIVAGAALSDELPELSGCAPTASSAAAGASTAAWIQTVAGSTPWARIDARAVR
ncbi:hypothetical protein ACN28S_19955 [Cystobacter fuscus]